MKRLLIVSGILFVIGIVAAIAGWIYFTKHPLDMLVAGRRWALKRAGGEKREIRGPAGRLTYFVAGSGPTIVLVHGANDQAGLWAKAVKDLSRDFRLVIPDLPGHGESDPPSGHLDYPMLVAGVESVIQKEAPGEKVVLIGNSMGGWIATLVAQKNPQRVSHLILENSSGISIDYKGPPLFPKNREEATQVMTAVQGPGKPPLPPFVLDDLVRRTPTSPMARLAKTNLLPFFLDGKLRDFPFPVTLVWGADDGVLPLDYARRFAGEFRESKLVTLPNCGHIPHYQCTDSFVNAVRGALGAPVSKDDAAR